MSVIGIGDSHDSGCALVDNGMVLSALNEERFTKNKNEVGFPYKSLRYLKESQNMDEVQAVALAWIGGNALISRMIPSWDRKRRDLWRRAVPKPSRPSMHLTNGIYKLIQNQRPRALWKAVGVPISSSITSKRLGNVSKELSHKKVYAVEHHLAHASSAYYPSGFKEALIITLDGAGDGLSGTVSIGDKGKITRLAEFRASTSIGIMYGAATVACDMRYSEDEGKLMSLAAYSYPKEIKELERICRYDSRKKTLVSDTGTRNELLLAEYMKDHILSKNDRESFAYAMQMHVQNQVLAIVKQWVAETGLRNVAVSGGFFSNVITNMLIEQLPEVKNLFIFPQMGDGGLPYGAACYIDFMLNGALNAKQIQTIYFGPSYQDAEISQSIKDGRKRMKLDVSEVKDPAKEAAHIITKEKKVILWFQGGMEYGPRALGNRSVLAIPNDQHSRDTINMIIKKRPYYQPFASSVLEVDAKKLFTDYVAPNRFMTSANHLKEDYYDDMVAAAHVDHTTRPQILGKENRLYRDLILEVKKSTGIGAVLNTSLNKHGKPMAMSPEDAIWTLENTGADTLVIGNYVVRKK
ncbi:MAG: hypothetical protein KGH60_04130 [Candidatus Micrarchaeota archaeon]|nr:hypothetical protein [Candidatus Micrarchaeota archaeon]